PPLVRVDAVPICIGAGAKRRVSGRGLGVCVIVVAVGEVCAVVQEEAEDMRRLQISSISLQIVLAELVDHHQHHQLRFAVVRGGSGGNGGKGNEQRGKGERAEAPAHFHRRLPVSQKASLYEDLGRRAVLWHAASPFSAA